MRKRLWVFMAFLMVIVTGCAEKPGTNTEIGIDGSQQITESGEVHIHSYIESVTAEAMCETDGIKTFTCECGDTYTESIEATGHVYEEYVFNNDATYMEDGTETAICVCGLTDTRTVEGSKLELPAEADMHGMSFEDWIPKVPQYCMENTDVYFEPSFDAPVIGMLSINEEVKITGWANNASELYPPFDKTEESKDINWSRIDYNGQTAYIPDQYTWKGKRDLSVSLNSLAANYPIEDGSGSGIVYPYNKGEWLYVYGACDRDLRISLNPYGCDFMEIYDGIEKNVIATITDASIKFEPTGNAYCTNIGDGVGSYYIYEIYYNGGIAYIDSLKAMYE